MQSFITVLSKCKVLSAPNDRFKILKPIPLPCISYEKARTYVVTSDKIQHAIPKLLAGVPHLTDCYEILSISSLDRCSLMCLPDYKIFIRRHYFISGS